MLQDVDWNRMRRADLELICIAFEHLKQDVDRIFSLLNEMLSPSPYRSKIFDLPYVS